MDIESGKRYELKSKKSDGKWWSHGSLKQSDRGYWGIGLRVSEELIKLINTKQKNEWLNFALYEAKPKEGYEKTDSKSHPTLDGDSIPFALILPLVVLFFNITHLAGA